MNENTIKVLNREGKVREGKVLLFCKDKETDRMYISYTFDEKNDDNVIVLASVLKCNSDSYYMDNLEDSEWQNLINNMKLTFNKDDELTDNVYILSVNDELSKDTIVVDRGHKAAAMREEIVIGLSESYVELIPKKKPVLKETNDFNFDSFGSFKDDYRFPEDKFTLPKNEVKDDFEDSRYGVGYQFERQAREEVKPDRSFREFEERYEEASKPSYDFSKYEDNLRSKYDIPAPKVQVQDEEDDEGKGDIAYEQILETLRANNELLAAIKEALAREKKGNR